MIPQPLGSDVAPLRGNCPGDLLLPAALVGDDPAGLGGDVTAALCGDAAVTR
jgi:hypothetical protein